MFAKYPLATNIAGSPSYFNYQALENKEYLILVFLTLPGHFYLHEKDKR